MELSKKENAGLSAENIKTLERAGIIPANTPPAQIAVFSQICKERGLSPFAKEIYLVGYGGRYSTIVGINGFRKLSDQTGLLAGIEDAKYDLQPDGQYKTASQYPKAGRVHSVSELPRTCTVTIYKIVAGVRCPFTHTIVIAEFNSGKQKWQSMPFQMAAKTAESFAHRKGFGSVNSGLFVEGEIGAITDTQEATIKPQVAPKKEKPVLKRGSDKWEDTVNAIAANKITIEYAEKNAVLSESHKDDLIEDVENRILLIQSKVENAPV